MKLLGNLRYASENYYVYLNDIKSKETWYLISPFHKKDIANHLLGMPLQYPVIDSTLYFEKNKVSSDYIIEAVSRTKISGRVEIYEKYLILDKLLSTLNYCRSYSFKESNVLENSNRLSNGNLIHTLIAKDSTVSISMVSSNKLYSSLEFKYNDIDISIRENTKIKLESDLEFVEASKSTRKKVLLSSVKSLDYESLGEILDLSFYEENGIVKKDYRSVKTIEEFDNIVIKGIEEEARACRARGEKLLLAVDTETTGLNMCCLSSENPDKDRVVAIPIAWKDNQGVVVFTDMEHFDNVPSEYVYRKLKPIMEYDNVELFKLNTSNQYAQKMNLFEDNTPIKVDETYLRQPIFREDINLVGHNVMFDGKAFYDNGIKSYWNNDTLSMAFNLNPRIIKGNNKLKNLTRKFFGHETPELDDILGKGNEDKYRYISDERVAIIYGCADSDYTRLVYKKLKSITPPKMLKSYELQDIPMLNQLYIAEYYGLRMDEEKVKQQGALVYEDLEILRKFMYSYVGRHVMYKNQIIPLKIRKDAGIIDEYAYRKLISEIKIDENATYDFDLTGTNIRRVLYDILEYPVVAKTDGKNPLPKVDKIVMDRLMRKLNDKPGQYLKKDVMSADGKHVLVKAKEFNKFKYPLAYTLSIYAAYNKEYTSYYKPIVEDNREGRLFKGFSLTRIETRRIMNPSQTMKGKLKVLVLPHSPDHYMMDYDMSQVEYRIMISFAEFVTMIEKMKDPEKDYHTETASLVNSIPAHKVSKKLRKQTKGISFGVPYGLGEMRLAINLFGEANEDTLYATRKLLYLFEQNNKPVIDLINSYRDSALIPREISDDLRDFIDAYKKDKDKNYILDADGKRIPSPVGMIMNPMGFYRLFDLDNLDKKKIGSIRRAAGNYPIQSFAAELFRKILIRFADRCRDEGLSDLVIWHMLIHDELLLSVHKSVHIMRMIKIIKESCMVTIKNHTKYFVGINIGDNWEECKDDRSELPVIFVERMIKRYEAGEFDNEVIDNPKEWIAKHKAEYIKNRIHECLEQLQPNIDHEPIDTKYILEHFSNYTVRAYVSDFYKCNHACTMEDDDAVYISKLESWVLEYYGEGKEIKYLDGAIGRVIKGVQKIEEVSLNLDDEEDISSSYWSFENEDLDEHYTKTIYLEDFNEEEEDDYYFEANENARTVADLMVSKKKSYKNLSVLNSQYVITVNRGNKVAQLKKYLEKYNDPTGYSVLFKTPLGLDRWIKVSSTIDLDELSKIIEEVNAC